MLFSRGDLPSIRILMECLQEFRDVSGLAVNNAKSNIFTAGIQNDTLDEALAMTEFARGHMPVRYLGIPLAAQRLLITDYSPLVDQIAGCIRKWTANPYPSLAGWSLFAPLFREWNAFGSRSSLSQWQLLIRSTDCAGPSYGILSVHRWHGRIFATRRRKAVWVSGISNPGTLPPCPSLMEHSLQGRHLMGQVGQRGLPTGGLTLGLAAEEGRLSTPSTTCRDPGQNYH
ncbi:hypothetical protein Sango_2810000 [Sesamum angolense]|uniref:Reverse transcriptase domain-containing protein n=1 Tax=Sesamum angolense TaxID=2727404 RepID=A0AAE1T7Q3_9LAMI|nr:hypothetical protein Sango_2810000 [Sesamum angolense]